MNDRKSPSRLDAIERTAHEFFTRLGKLNQEGLDEGEATSRISVYQRCPLITDPEMFHELRDIAEGEDAPRGILNLMGFIGEHACLPPFINADEEISHQLGRSILRVGEEEVPYAVSEQWLMQQKDRGMREAIEDERGKTLKKVVPLIKQAHVEARRRCIDLGYTDMNEMWHSLRGIDFGGLKAKGEEMLSETQDIFSDQMQWLARRRAGLRINELKRHDILYIFTANEFDRMFPTAPHYLNHHS
ncbi:MAG: hypothetical protein L0922_06540, partial [Candidatus Mariimomonas ferrooxydans]